MKTQGRDLLPDFIIGGTGEAGTSFLHKVLIQHPQVFLASRMVPETGFFNKRHEYARGLDHYRTHFRGWSGETLIGERTSGYLHVAGCAERIHKHLPSAKIILCLRNPVERAFSNYRFTCQQGLETWSFSKAIRHERERVARIRDPFWQDTAPYSYVERGFYSDQLMRYLQFFDSDRILLIKSERLRDHWLDEIQRVLRFLEVNDEFKPKKAVEFNTSDVRSLRWQRLARRFYGLRFPQLIEDTRIPGRPAPLGITVNLRNRRRPMKEPDRAYLRKVYADSNRKLATLAGWDLSDWTAGATDPEGNGAKGR